MKCTNNLRILSFCFIVLPAHLLWWFIVCFVTVLEVIGLFSLRPFVYGPRRVVTSDGYNVTGRRTASFFKVLAMWYLWTALMVVSVAVAEPETLESGPVATTRAPHRTLDRHAAELAWKSWLQSPESGSQNAPPRRITTKSLFITPLVCPKGQRLDRNGCVQIVTVNKDEHERILLEELNALFTSAPSGDVLYDYGDDEPGPLQLSIPIGLDPQASPLQAQEPSAQAQENLPDFTKIDKKDEYKPMSDISIEAELELLKLQQPNNEHNHNVESDNTNILNHNVLNNFLSSADKPKRNSPPSNDSEDMTTTEETKISTDTLSDEGQKEQVYGHVNIDPILYQTDSSNENAVNKNNDQADNKNSTIEKTVHIAQNSSSQNLTKQEVPAQQLDNKERDESKLNPENDYSDIGEAIKLISRYAEVTTDELFSKEHKKYSEKDESVLGTRTKLKHRRPKPKQEIFKSISPDHVPSEKLSTYYPKGEVIFRYPWASQHSPTPPPDYPFRHLQDYWPGWKQIGGVYNVEHENPRRHHHSYPHNYLRQRIYPAGYQEPMPRSQETFSGPIQSFAHRMPEAARPTRSHTRNRDLYSLLGLRHWFSSEGTSKR